MTQANDTFYGIPCDIRNQILNQTRGKIISYINCFIYCLLFSCEEILVEANHFQQIIANIIADVDTDLNDVCFHLKIMFSLCALFNQILDEDGFIGDVRNQSRDIQEAIGDYFNPRLVYRLNN